MLLFFCSLQLWQVFGDMWRVLFKISQTFPLKWYTVKKKSYQSQKLFKNVFTPSVRSSYCIHGAYLMHIPHRNTPPTLSLMSCPLRLFNVLLLLLSPVFRLYYKMRIIGVVACIHTDIPVRFTFSNYFIFHFSSLPFSHLRQRSYSFKT